MKDFYTTLKTTIDKDNEEDAGALISVNTASPS